MLSAPGAVSGHPTGSHLRSGTPPSKWVDEVDSISASGWVKDAVNGVLSCDVIDQSIPLTRHSTWRDQSVSCIVKLTGTAVHFGKIQTIPFKDILETRGYSKLSDKDLLPILSDEGVDFLGRCMTIQFRWVRQTTTSTNLIHLVFPTATERESFNYGIECVKEKGVRCLLATAKAKKNSRDMPNHVVKRAQEKQNQVKKDLRGMRDRLARLEKLHEVVPETKKMAPGTYNRNCFC